MRSRYKIHNEEGYHFITCTIVGWLPLFTSPHYFDILLNTLKYHQQNSSLKLFAYVILENHLHLVLQSEQLQKMMHSFKTYTAKQINLVTKLHLVTQLSFEAGLHLA